MQRKRVNSWGQKRYGFCVINSRLEFGKTDLRGNEKELGFRNNPNILTVGHITGILLTIVHIVGISWANCSPYLEAC